MMEYPLAPRVDWWGECNYLDNGGRMTTMSPRAFLVAARPLDEQDELTLESVSDLAAHMGAGQKLDPLCLFDNGKEDGRHRALASIRLGLEVVPVIDFRKPTRGLIP